MQTQKRFQSWRGPGLKKTTNCVGEEAEPGGCIVEGFAEKQENELRWKRGKALVQEGLDEA